MADLDEKEKLFNDIVEGASGRGQRRYPRDVVVTKATSCLRAVSRLADAPSAVQTNLRAHVLAAKVASFLLSSAALDSSDEDDLADAAGVAKVGLRHVDRAMTLSRRAVGGLTPSLQRQTLSEAQRLFETLVAQVRDFFVRLKIHVRAHLFKELANACGPAHRARVWLTAADVAHKLAVTQIDKGEYALASQSLRECEQPVAELNVCVGLFYAKDAMEEEFDDLDDSIKRTRAQAVTMAHINRGKALLDRGTKGSGEFDVEVVWRSVDEFHNARVVANQSRDTKAEAVASSYIAKVFFSCFKDNQAARAHARNSIDLGTTLGEFVEGLDWFQEAKRIMQAVQESEKLADDKAKEGLRAKMRAKMEGNKAVLEIESANGPLELFKKLYELYPPKKKTVAVLPDAYPEGHVERRKLVQSVIDDYNSDNQVGDDATLEWKVVCDLLKETYVNPIYTNIKGE